MCNTIYTKQSILTEEEADKTAQQRDRERDKFERTYQRDVLFLGCERSCRHISARIDTRDCKKRTLEN